MITFATIKVDQARAEIIRDFYKVSSLHDSKNPYKAFQGTTKDGVSFVCYRNRKEIYTVSFSGGNREEVIGEAEQFSKNATVKSYDETKKKEKEDYFEGWEDLSEQVGSDEVGVGDFFGPLLVAATYIAPSDIPFLEKLGINDSKKMDDSYIEKIGAVVKRRIHNYVILVSPHKLSDLESRSFKMHKTMAKCHNLAQKGVIEKYGISSNVIVYIDQFEPEANYRKLVGSLDLITNPLYFRVHGETYYPSVACASVIARYTFLKEWEKMEEHFKTRIPKGAGAQVDNCYQMLLSKYGREELDPYVKRFFRNYRKS
ncbi:MAG: ribonuclease HIII [Bacilli bacterium]